MFYKVIHLMNETPEALKLFKKVEVLNLAQEVKSHMGCYIAQRIQGVKIVENDIYFLRSFVRQSYPSVLFFISRQ